VGILQKAWIGLMLFIVIVAVVCAIVACVIVIFAVERFLGRIDREQAAGQAWCDKANAEFKAEWIKQHPGWPDDGRPWHFYRMQ
jgi:hypothetical protein